MINHKLLYGLRKSSGLCNRLSFLFTNFEIQPRKPVDSQKQSIILMNTSPKYDISLPYLKMSKQYTNKSKGKFILSINEQITTLGEVCQIIVDSLFIAIEVKGGLERFIQILEYYTTLLANQGDPDRLGLHTSDSLNNFIRTIEYFDGRVNQVLVKVLLLLLANYYEYSALLTEPKKLQIIQFLAHRGYITQSMLQKVSKTQLGSPKLRQSFAELHGEELMSKFREVSYTLLSAIHIHQCLSLDPSPLLSQSYKSTISDLIPPLVQNYFSFFQSPSVFENLLATSEIQILVIDYLFKKEIYRNRVYKIVLSLLDPWVYHNVNMNPNLFRAIFDNIYMYSAHKEAAIVTRILDKYSQCISCSTYYPKQPLRGGSSLIFLLKKYGYNNLNLLSDIFQNYLWIAPEIEQINRHTSIRKNKFHLISKILLRIHQLSCFLEIIQPLGLSYEKEAIAQLEKYTYKTYVDNVYFSTYFYSKDPKKGEQEAESGSNVYNLKKKDVQGLSAHVDRLQKQTRITKMRTLYNFSTPTDLQSSPGQRLKIILCSILSNRFLSLQVNSFTQLYYFLSKKQQCLKILNEYKYYPGMAETAFYVYYYAKYNGFDYQNTELEKFVKNSRHELDIKLSRNILAKDKEGYGEGVVKHPQILGKKIIRLKSFLEDSQANLVNRDIILHIKKFEPLLAKVTEFLRTFKQQNPQIRNIYAFPNHVEFPFFADYSIFCNNKKLFVLLVSPTEKQQYQQILKKLKQKTSGQVPKLSISQQIELAYSTPAKQSATKTEQFPADSKHKQLLIRYFEEKGTVILISNDQEIKVLKLAIEKK